MRFRALPAVLLLAASVAQAQRITPVITFLNLHLTDSPVAPRVELVSRKVVKGEFKVGPTAAEKRAGQLLVQVRASATAAPELELSIANPLAEDLEFSPGEQRLAHTVVHASQGDTAVRLPMSLEGKVVTVQLVRDDGALRELAVFRF